MNDGKYIIWIDNTKGIAIILVVLYHCGYLVGKENLQWFQHAVPLFLFCSAYLLKEKDIHDYFCRKRMLRLWKRIFCPYLLLEVFVVALLLLIDNIFNIDFNIGVKEFVKLAGLGPGSYFPVIYIQCWLLIPFLVLLKHRYSFAKGFVVFIVLCAILEFLFLIVCENRTWLWRLLAIRYLMVLFVAVNYEEYVRRKILSILLIITSIALAVIDIYIRRFDDMGWDGYHYYTSFYILLLIPLFEKLSFNLLALIGRYSYDIFLAQLGYFAFAHYFIMCNRIVNFSIVVILSCLIISIKKQLIRYILN